LVISPLNAELNPIRNLLALLGAHLILHVSRIRVKLFNFPSVKIRFLPTLCLLFRFLLFLSLRSLFTRLFKAPNARKFQSTCITGLSFLTSSFQDNFKCSVLLIFLSNEHRFAATSSYVYTILLLLLIIF